MGRKLLSSYRYTPIQPVSVSEPADEPGPAVQPAAPRIQPSRSANAPRSAMTGSSPPKYTPPPDLPSYEDVAQPNESVAVIRLGRMISAVDDFPLGTGCTFWGHALMVTTFGIFGFLMSWCCGVPSHARRLGRTLGIGMDILKTAVYLRYHNAIMCWMETNVLPNFPTGGSGVNGTHTPATADGFVGITSSNMNGVEVVNYDGQELINFCSLPPVTEDMGMFFPFMCVLGAVLVLASYAQWAKVQRLHRDGRSTA